MKTKLDKRKIFMVSHNYDTKRSTFRAEDDFLSQLALSPNLDNGNMYRYISY